MFGVFNVGSLSQTSPYFVIVIVFMAVTMCECVYITRILLGTTLNHLIYHQILGRIGNYTDMPWEGDYGFGCHSP